ncbi:hypothetical protein [Halorussus amylolyticus]|uniref:hypothetical protein n=1 Tax=Halorussus amylolyticus TaxID=1126242 RepID=UPI00104CE582|nr:hypothetical protein [Halorussus amylolyticus]
MPSANTPQSESAESDQTQWRRRRFLEKTGVAVSSLATASSLAGCLDRREPSDSSAIEAIEATFDALDDIEGYAVEIGGSVEARASGETSTTVLDGEQRIDETARRSHAFVETTTNRDEQYLDDETLYERCDSSRYTNVDEVWYPTETKVDWAKATLLGSQQSLLEISEVYDRGTEDRFGGEARVVEFAVNPEKYDRYQRRLGGADENTPTPDTVSLTQWLVEDRPVRVRTEVERGSSFGPTVEEDIRYDVTYEPVSIELPDIVEDEDACPEI